MGLAKASKVWAGEAKRDLVAGLKKAVNASSDWDGAVDLARVL